MLNRLSASISKGYFFKRYESTVISTSGNSEAIARNNNKQVKQSGKAKNLVHLVG